jgi:hypothetical protein
VPDLFVITHAIFLYKVLIWIWMFLLIFPYFCVLAFFIPLINSISL